MHRSVAITFLGFPDFPKAEVNHKDGNKLNNFVGTLVNNYEDGNLEWSTRAKNMQHASAHGLINRDSEARKAACRANRAKAVENAKKPVVQLSLTGAWVAEYDSVVAAAANTGIAKTVISQVCTRSKYRKSSGGFIWVYKEEYNRERNYVYQTAQHSAQNLGVVQYSLNGEEIAQFASISDAARHFGVQGGSSYISDCCRGKWKTYKGYIWKFSQ